jgi:hypothetical protein
MLLRGSYSLTLLPLLSRAIRLRDNAADFIAASICQDFVCHSDLAE